MRKQRELKGLVVQCLHCSASVYKAPWQINRRSGNMFCSTQCARAFDRGIKPIAKRLDEKRIITERGCHEWGGSINAKGYGEIRLTPKRLGLCHRLAWTEVHGPIPKGLFVCHKCDNRRCYNLDHLFLGTHGDNMRDMAIKQRCRIKPKIPIADIPVIIARKAAGVSTKVIAEEYGLAPSNVCRVLRGAAAYTKPY